MSLHGREPRVTPSLERRNRGLMSLDEADLVQAAEQAVPREGVDLETVGEALALPPVIEKEGAVAGALDALEELLGDDLVGVYVGAVEGRHAASDALDRLH